LTSFAGQRERAAAGPLRLSFFDGTIEAGWFIVSLGGWNSASAKFNATYPGIPVATTEPVADYILQAISADNMTHWTLRADIMNGV
jgi:zinc/manganese transport system substrate-binding protein